MSGRAVWNEEEQEEEAGCGAVAPPTRSMGRGAGRTQLTLIVNSWMLGAVRQEASPGDVVAAPGVRRRWMQP